MPRVLLVEDDASVAAVVRYHLEGAGLEGVFASEVEGAWEQLRNSVPEAAVIDIKLPGSDGWSLIERIRKDPRLARVPIIVLTGILEPETIERARSFSCEYLSKPFAASALVAKIQTLLAAPTVAQSAMASARSDRKAHKVELIPIGVVLLLDQYQIEGSVHVVPEISRFSDAWESLMRDSRSFFPITDARITSFDGRLLGQTPFAEVSKVDVRAVFPMDVGLE